VTPYTVAAELVVQIDPDRMVFVDGAAYMSETQFCESFGIVDGSLLDLLLQHNRVKPALPGREERFFSEADVRTLALALFSI
jgi:hypothetical protein